MKIDKFWFWMAMQSFSFEVFSLHQLLWVAFIDSIFFASFITAAISNKEKEP